jgi:hypothetical protein
MILNQMWHPALYKELRFRGKLCLLLFSSFYHFQKRLLRFLFSVE